MTQSELDKLAAQAQAIPDNGISYEVRAHNGTARIVCESSGRRSVERFRDYSEASAWLSSRTWSPDDAYL